MHMSVNGALCPNVIEDYVSNYLKFPMTKLIYHSPKFSVIVPNPWIHFLLQHIYPIIIMAL